MNNSPDGRRVVRSVWWTGLTAAVFSLAFATAAVFGLVVHPLQCFRGDADLAYAEVTSPGFPGAYIWPPVFFAVGLVAVLAPCLLLDSFRILDRFWARLSVTLTAWVIGDVSGTIPGSLLTIRLGRVVDGFYGDAQVENAALVWLRTPTLMVCIAIAVVLVFGAVATFVAHRRATSGEGP